VLLAWSPAVLGFLVLAASQRYPGRIPLPASPLIVLALTVLPLAAGATATLAQPRRGPHDRLAGTWVIPR
jgi:hypothetical protein